MTVRRKRWIVTLCVILSVCLLGVAYVVTFQIDVLQNVARKLIAGALGEQVTIGHVRVEVFPRPELQLMDVSIGDPGRDTPIFQASDIRLGIRFFSWGQDALTPNELSIENARVDLERDQQGRWNWRDLFHDGSPSKLWVLLSGYSLALVNGSIDVEDRFRREVPLRVRAEAIELQVERLALEGSTDMFLSARLSDRKKDSLLSSYGTIEHIGAFLDFERTEPTALRPQLALRTRVELDRRTLWEVTELFRIGEVPAGFKGQTSAQGHIHFAPGVRGYDLVISDLVVLTDVVDLNADMSMAGLFHHEPWTVSSTWTSSPLAIQHLPQLLPNDWLASDLYQKTVRQVRRGKIQAVSATFSGSARQGLGYSLGGEFHASEGTVTFGQKWGKAEHVGGVIHVLPDRIQMSDFHGLYGHIPVTEATGEIVLSEHGPWLTTEVAGDVSPAQVFDIVQKIGAWDAGHYTTPALQDQAGQGAMTIRFGGPLLHPEHIVFRSAEYRPEQVQFRLHGLQGAVTNVSGLFAFSQDDLRFENVRGLYGKSDFHLEGKMKFAQPISSDEVTIQGRMHVHDLVTLFPDLTVPEREILSGAANYMVVVAGKPDTPIIRGAVDLQGLGIVVPGMIEKTPALEGQLAFNVRVDKTRQLSFKHVSLTFPSVALAGQGHIRYGPTPAIHASFTADPIHFDALPDGLLVFDKTVSAGKLEMALALKGTGRDWRSWNKSGWVTFTNGTVNIGGMTPPVSHVFLRATLNGHTADLNHLRWKIGENLARITGVVQQWDSQPKMTFALTASQFDLARLIPSGERSFVRKAFEHIARTATVSGDFQIDRASYNALSFSPLTGRLWIRNSRIGIEAIHGKTEHGTIQGRLLAHLPVQQPGTVRTWFDVRNIPLLALEQTFLDMKTLDERFITGMASAKGVLAGHGNDARGVLPTLTGNMELSIVDGRIKKGTVVPKILTILNIPSMLQGQVDLQKEGYPFDKQTGTLTIANGRITSEDIVMNGPILKMTAAGQYDFMRDDLDMVAAASPFGPYFNFLRNIPLFEMFMDDSEVGVISALFEIKGSLHDPEVTPMPLESFSSGLTRFGELAFGVLKKTITLPQKLFFDTGTLSDPASQSADSIYEEEEF